MVQGWNSIQMTPNKWANKRWHTHTKIERKTKQGQATMNDSTNRNSQTQTRTHKILCENANGRKTFFKAYSVALVEADTPNNRAWQQPPKRLRREWYITRRQQPFENTAMQPVSSLLLCIFFSLSMKMCLRARTCARALVCVCMLQAAGGEKKGPKNKYYFSCHLVYLFIVFRMRWLQKVFGKINAAHII